MERENLAFKDRASSALVFPSRPSFLKLLEADPSGEQALARSQVSNKRGAADSAHSPLNVHPLIFLINKPQVSLREAKYAVKGNKLPLWLEVTLLST